MLWVMKERNQARVIDMVIIAFIPISTTVPV